MPLWEATGNGWRNLVTGEVILSFVSGQTRPYYELTADFTGARNVGTNPAISLSTADVVYDSNGVAAIGDSGLYQDLQFDGGVIDVRSNATFKNCRFILPASYTRTDDSIKALVRVMSGTNTTNVLFEDCEFHIRGQRPFVGTMGRNATFRRCVWTGGVDGVSDSTGGTAPNLGTTFVLEDCIVASVGWWYSPTINSDIHGSDEQSHNDCIQKTTSLYMDVSNTALVARIDPFVGTGTPGSGRDAGSPYVPPGYQYNTSQAQMEDWREQLTQWTLASQSWEGESQQLSTGSLACVMLNAGNIDLDHCYFAGGNVQVNATTSSLPNPIDVSITDSKFYNDMSGGTSSRKSNPVLKGNAILGLANKPFGLLSGNSWFDNAALLRVTESGYWVWR